jgi:hypothetical protein
VVLLLVIALIAGVIPVGVDVLVGGVELLPLGAVIDEVGGTAAHEADPITTRKEYVFIGGNNFRRLL